MEESKRLDKFILTSHRLSGVGKALEGRRRDELSAPSRSSARAHSGVRTGAARVRATGSPARSRESPQYY
jgi:hypothetical protein